MSLTTIFDIAGSAVSAQSQRLNTVASNIANADTAAAPGTQPYRAKQVVFQSVPVANGAAQGVRVAEVTEDNTAARRLYDPRHPHADSEGYVNLSNVNVVEEMVNMIAASRSYQNNIETMNTAKSLLLKTLQLGS
jgi:flagellar basal-body rod protein FlgC